MKGENAGLCKLVSFLDFIYSFHRFALKATKVFIALRGDEGINDDVCEYLTTSLKTGPTVH